MRGILLLRLLIVTILCFHMATHPLEQFEYGLLKMAAGALAVACAGFPFYGLLYMALSKRVHTVATVLSLIFTVAFFVID